MKYHMRIRSLSNRRACYIEFRRTAEVSFPVLVTPADAKDLKT